MKKKKFNKGLPSLSLGGLFLFSLSLAADSKVRWTAERLVDTPLFNASRVEKVKRSVACEDLQSKLSFGNFLGAPYVVGGLQELWKPWSESDRKAVEGCDHFPCDVKLDSKEVATLTKLPVEKRLDGFFEAVGARVKDYEAKNTRREYEFPGAPVEPWKQLKTLTKGHSFPKTLEKEPKKLFARYHRFTDESYRPIRQVLDVRQKTEKSGSETRISWFVRDVYTAHYFDGWGEWIEVVCDSKKDELEISQRMLIEFDLYKKQDVLSRISRGAMTKNLEEQTGIYLRIERDRLLETGGLPTTAPTPRPRL